MEARALTPYPITAFTGRELVCYEWRQVPVGNENEANRLAGAGLVELRETGELTAKNATELDGGDSSPVLAVDLDGLTVADLQELARERGVSYRGLRKTALIAALRDD